MTARKALGHKKVPLPGLAPGIHVFLLLAGKDVGGRVKPGHGGLLGCSP